jgi:hypothetical protein
VPSARLKRQDTGKGKGKEKQLSSSIIKFLSSIPVSAFCTFTYTFLFFGKVKNA